MFLVPYGQAATIQGIPLIAAGLTSYQANPTLASGDVKTSTDGGAFANIEGSGTFANFASVVPAASSAVQINLNASQTTCKIIVITFSDAAGAEWQDQRIIVQTYGNPNAEHPNLGVRQAGVIQL